MWEKITGKNIIVEYASRRSGKKKNTKLTTHTSALLVIIIIRHLLRIIIILYAATAVRTGLGRRKAGENVIIIITVALQNISRVSSE